MKTSLPTALVFGFDQIGEITLQSDVYFEEGLIEDVNLVCYDSADDIHHLISKHNPDIIVTIGDDFKNIDLLGQRMLETKHIHYDTQPYPNIIANDIVCQSTFWACNSYDVVFKNNDTPIISVFTPTYQTGERIFRTYESLKAQTYQNWEWVVVDDSPFDDFRTFEFIKMLSDSDNRIKYYKITPNSGGNIGEVKHRAAMLCNGEWLVELDHDDVLMPTALEDILSASKQYPDTGFIYSDCCELYDDGEMRQYGYIGDDWYAHPENRFNWGYAGHTWETHYGKDYLVHHYQEINPKTIRFNIGMPNHLRAWRSDVYHKIGGHNRNVSVADDFELIVRTFLETKFTHIKKMLYLQYNNRNSTVDNNATDINRRARLIKDAYDLRIHNRIEDLGGEDWNWDYQQNSSYKFQNGQENLRYGDAEVVLNYIVE